MSKDFPYSFKNGISLYNGCMWFGMFWWRTWSGFIWQWQEEECAFAWLSLHICSVLHWIWSSYFTIPLQAGNLDYGSVTTLIFIDKSWSLLVELWASWIILSLCNEANILLPAWGLEFNVTKNKGSFLCALPLPHSCSFSFLSSFSVLLFPKQRCKFPELSCSAGGYAGVKWERFIPDPRAVVWWDHIVITFEGRRASWVRHPLPWMLEEGEANGTFCGQGLLVRVG